MSRLWFRTVSNGKDLYLGLSETELILGQGNVSQDDISGLFRLDRVLDQIGAQDFVSVFVFFTWFINGRKQRVGVGGLAQRECGRKLGYIQQRIVWCVGLVPFLQRNCSKFWSIKNFNHIHFMFVWFEANVRSGWSNWWFLLWTLESECSIDSLSLGFSRGATVIGLEECLETTWRGRYLCTKKYSLYAKVCDEAR